MAHFKLSRLAQDNSIKRIRQDLAELDDGEVKTILTSEEKRYLLYIERGDVASVRHILKKYMKENQRKPGTFNINCVDPLGRSSLAISIENENMEMIQLLLDEEIDPTDSLLYAINEEYVEGVEILLAHEEKIHKDGQPYSWQRLEGLRANYTPDITPLILAAHKNNYEILKQLLDRGAALPMPHDVKCACDECTSSSAEDSLRHSLSRINAYKALCSPSLICLSSKDPLVTSFSLSKELFNLMRIEDEFKEEYTNLRNQVMGFSECLIEKTRTSFELEVVLNYDPEGATYVRGQVMHFTKLREAVSARQKKFVAHANVQQLLGSVWYDGMPGFKRLGPLKQLLEVFKIGASFPIFCLGYLLAPNSRYGLAMTKPFIKFIVHSSSYLNFLTLLVIVSLRVETHLIMMFGNKWMIDRLQQQQKEERGSIPSIVEFMIIIYILGFIWGEIRGLWRDGILEFLKDLWNIVDFISIFFYMNWIFLRLTAWYQTHRELWADINPYTKRELWHPFDPMLLADGMFGAANIFSFLKLIHIFSVHPHLGPLQIALGRMVFDIIKFLFIYTLVLFAFACGMNQLLWYYADIDRRKCYSMPGGKLNSDADHSCDAWRRFTNLFETSQSLFWASFGLVDLFNFDLTGIKSFTRFWALLMFGSYNLINVIVLLNLLIAMMSNSYSAIVEKCDVEWKFARSKLWMSYFEAGGDVPPPFNLLPSLRKFFVSPKKRERKSFKVREEEQRDIQYQKITRNLVRRYVTSEQRKFDESEITEDDINEVKQNISTFKYELLNVLKINGMKTGDKHQKEDVALGRKQQARERRLKKGFNIGMVEGIDLGAIFTTKKKQLDFAEIVMNALTKGSDKNRRSRSGSQNQDHIGSSMTSQRRQSLRVTRRRSPWNRIQFYQKRGVFLGGEINNGALNDAKLRMKREMRRPPVGWRKLQRLQTRGLVTQENADGRSMSISKSMVALIDKSIQEEQEQTPDSSGTLVPPQEETSSHCSTPIPEKEDNATMTKIQIDESNDYYPSAIESSNDKEKEKNSTLIEASNSDAGIRKEEIFSTSNTEITKHPEEHSQNSQKIENETINAPESIVQPTPIIKPKDVNRSRTGWL